MWDEKSICEKMLDALMIDDRGNRQGFPFAVAKEILALKMHINPEYLNNLPD